MRYWLMKTEPDVFSFADLVAAKDHTTAWEGVRNYQARNFMRDLFRCGDLVFIYHSNTAEPSIVGTANVVREAYADPTQFDPASPYYDPKARHTAPRWVLVDVRARERFTSPVSLARLKSSPTLSGMLVVQRGQRLSVQPVNEAHWREVCDMGRPEPAF